MNFVWIFTLLVVVLAFYYMKNVKYSAKSDKKLTQNEKIIVLLTEIAVPVIAGAIYYYGWKDRFPKKANEANKYSFLVFGAWVIGIALMLFVYSRN